MNKRIKELAEQAGIKFSKDWGECYTGNVQLERFAELVRQNERELTQKIKDANIKGKFIQSLIDRVNELDRLLHEANNREWVGLTEEEVDAIRKEIFEKYKKALFVTRDVTSENNYSAFNFYRAIEEKLRSKNDF